MAEIQAVGGNKIMEIELTTTEDLIEMEFR